MRANECLADVLAERHGQGFKRRAMGLPYQLLRWSLKKLDNVASAFTWSDPDGKLLSYSHWGGAEPGAPYRHDLVYDLERAERYDRASANRPRTKTVQPIGPKQKVRRVGIGLVCLCLLAGAAFMISLFLADDESAPSIVGSWLTMWASGFFGLVALAIAFVMPSLPRIVVEGEAYESSPYDRAIGTWYAGWVDRQRALVEGNDDDWIFIAETNWITRGQLRALGMPRPPRRRVANQSTGDGTGA